VIHLYTGNGKGKTTSAFGLAMRASGQGLRVCIFQFLKPKSLLCGEQVIIRKIKGIDIVAFKQSHPMFEDVSMQELKKIVEKDFIRTEKIIHEKRYDMIVLDEIINAVDQGFVDKKRFLDFLRSIPEGIELVLTGRGDISAIEQYADYITVMVEKKHPFRKNIPARKGIEY